MSSAPLDALLQMETRAWRSGDVSAQNQVNGGTTVPSTPYRGNAGGRSRPGFGGGRPGGGFSGGRSGTGRPSSRPGSSRSGPARRGQ